MCQSFKMTLFIRSRLNKMLLALVCMFGLLIHPSKGFFKDSPLQLNSIPSRLNLTCTSDFGDTDPFTNCEYCVYEFFSNGSDTSIYHDCIYLTNTYRLVTQRCTGFTNASDVGYGLCSPLSFEYFDIDLICICASDFCNENFTACKQSVDRNPTLSALPTPISTLTSRDSAITCQDTPIGSPQSTYYCSRDSTPYINLTQCEDYVRSHTVACMYLESDNGNYLTVVALPDEDYEYVLADQIQSMQRMADKPNTVQYFNETPTAFYIRWNETLFSPDNYSIISNRCYCLNNNCNSNLTACLQSYRNQGSANTGTRVFGWSSKFGIHSEIFCQWVISRCLQCAPDYARNDGNGDSWSK